GAAAALALTGDLKAPLSASATDGSGVGRPEGRPPLCGPLPRIAVVRGGAASSRTAPLRAAPAGTGPVAAAPPRPATAAPGGSSTDAPVSRTVMMFSQPLQRTLSTLPRTFSSAME